MHIGKSGVGVGGFRGKGVGKGSHDAFICKSVVGVGGLRMSGIGGSELLGVGGVGFGGQVVEEGHVGRLVGRFEGRSYHDLQQDFHGSSVAIDNDHDDGDDDKTSTHNNDVNLPTNKQPQPTDNNHDRQRQQPIDNNHDRQQDNNLEQPFHVNDT